MNIQNLIWGLEELADREFQERVWLGKSEGEMSSFEEAVCSTFDDTGLSIILNSGRGGEQIPTELREKAIQLRHLIKRVPNDGIQLDIINHPAMKAVRSIAEEMLAILRN
tara:strand:- start:3143 stop:3472 length:330 start_codon:yes stop_codon:yes gene_type:complete